MFFPCYGVLDDTDRDALQDEMNELCGEIDRMATTDNFNGHKLMDGSIGGTDSIKLTCDKDAKTIKYSSPEMKSYFGGGVPTQQLAAGKYTYDGTNNTWKNEDNKAFTITFQLEKGDTLTVDTALANTNTATTANGATFTATSAVGVGTYTWDGTAWKDAAGNAIAGNATVATPTNGDTFIIKEGINLQVGESSTSADRLEVKINSFHTDTLFGGLDGFVNITNDETDNAATAAVKIIKPTAANSRIRDTDMAKEMMAYTAKNVIAQAAQTMLAQANSQPQNVLSLLQ